MADGAAETWGPFTHPKVQNVLSAALVAKAAVPMLGGMRPRPRADRGVSRTNASSVPGGLFGREPAQYSYAAKGGDGLDFLSRVEDAEMRDMGRRAPSGAIGSGNEHTIAYGMGDAPTTNYTMASLNEQQQQRQRTRQKNWQGSIQMGDDSRPASRANGMYQTTSGQTQLHMQQQYQSALTRQQERTLIDIMMNEHGMSEGEARYEIELYNKEMGQEKANALVKGTVPRDQRGFAKQQYQPPQRVYQPPPQQRALAPYGTSAPPQAMMHFNRPNDMAAGAPRSVTAVHSGVVKERPNARFDPNKSSTAGGIFAQGVWS